MFFILRFNQLFLLLKLKIAHNLVKREKAFVNFGNSRKLFFADFRHYNTLFDHKSQYFFQKWQKFILKNFLKFFYRLKNGFL